MKFRGKMEKAKSTLSSCAFLCVVLVVAGTGNAVAQGFNGGANPGYNYHIQWSTFANLYNSFAYLRNNELSSLYPTDDNSFETLEQWRSDQGDNTWEEIGLTNGTLNNSLWIGGFGALYQEGIYREFTLGELYSNHEYAPSTELRVETNNTSVVDYNYDSTVYASVSTASTSADAMIVGVESNSSTQNFNSFDPGMDSSYWQYYAGGCCYTRAPFNPVYYDDSPNGQYSTYGFDSSGEPHAYWY